MAARVVPEGLPGPGMAAALDAADLAVLSDDELVDVMAGWRRVTSWAQSCELAAVAELVRRREVQHPSAPPVKLGEFIADEIAAELTLSSGAAGMWVGLACKLDDQLPLTNRAPAEGRIDLTRARVIADGLLGVHPDTAALVEQAVIDEAARIPAARLRHRVREAIKAVDPEAAEQRRERARKVRSLEKWATAAGTCDLAFREMSEEDAEAIFNRINAVAQAMRADGDARPIDAIRHDLGVALLRGIPLPEAAHDLHHSGDEDEMTAGVDQADSGQNNPDPDHPNANHADSPAGAEGSVRPPSSETDRRHAVADAAAQLTGLRPSRPSLRRRPHHSLAPRWPDLPMQYGHFVPTPS